MENYEYSKSFPPEYQDDLDIDSDETRKIVDFIHNYERNMKSSPRFLIPFAPKFFDKTVVACEKIAKEFSGRSKAEINYSLYTATIELWCCYVEFVCGEFMSILHQISLHATSVRFTPLTTGELHIEIIMPYFISATELE